jgi:hypothetical protein
LPYFVSTILALAASALPQSAAAPARPAAARAPAAIVGRLVLRDGSAPVAPKEARRVLGGAPLAVNLRSGWNVATAHLEDDGFFVVEAEPGGWVIESVSAGTRLEFVDPPLALEVQSGEVACAGRVELSFRDLGAELGKGTGRAAATGGCADLGARAQGVAGARSVRARIPEPLNLPVRRSAWELATLLRAGGAWRVGGGEGSPEETHLFATAILGINRPVGDPGAVSVSASLAQIDVESGRSRRTIAAGLGYGLGSFFELAAGPELQLGGDEGSGAGAFGQIRLGSEAFGLSLRLSRGKAGQVVTFGLDLAPVWVLGAML